MAQPQTGGSHKLDARPCDVVLGEMGSIKVFMSRGNVHYDHHYVFTHEFQISRTRRTSWPIRGIQSLASYTLFDHLAKYTDFPFRACIYSMTCLGAPSPSIGAPVYFSIWDSLKLGVSKGPYHHYFYSTKGTLADDVKVKQAEMSEAYISWYVSSIKRVSAPLILEKVFLACPRNCA